MLIVVLNGNVNRTNFGYWSDQNLTFFETHTKVNDWTGILGNVNNGPLFLVENLNVNR